MSPKIVDRAQRKESILEAAFVIFVEHGYHKATLNSIARAAGMGQGTLYYYFPSKDELFWGVYEQLMARMGGWMVERLISIEEPRERLNELLKLMFYHFPEVGISFGEETGQEDESLEGMLGFHYVLMEFWLHARRNGMEEIFYQRLSHYQVEIIEQVARLIEEVGSEDDLQIDAKASAHLMLALRDGLSIQLRVGSLSAHGDMLERCRQLIFESFQDGLPTLEPDKD